jgi:hypothetical protein
MNASFVGIGGLIGSDYNGNVANINISNSYYNGNITNTMVSSTAGTGGPQLSVGGIVGYWNPSSSFSMTFAGCFSSGTYTFAGTANTNIFIGGFAGLIVGSGGSITNSYTMATVTTTGTFSGVAGAEGGFIGEAASATTALTVSSSYAANPSLGGSGANYNQGFLGVNGNVVPTFSNCYYDTGGSVPANFYTPMTSYSTAQMQVQSNFGGLTFGTGSTTNWQMPLSNSLASPTTLLSPVLQWQCTANNTVKTASCL